MVLNPHRCVDEDIDATGYNFYKHMYIKQLCLHLSSSFRKRKQFLLQHTNSVNSVSVKMLTDSVYTHKQVQFKGVQMVKRKSRRECDTESVSQGYVIGRDSLCPGWSLAEHRPCPGLQRPEETSTPLVSAVQGEGTESLGPQVPARGGGERDI